jgi:hypothetical protein
MFFWLSHRHRSAGLNRAHAEENRAHAEENRVYVQESRAHAEGNRAYAEENEQISDWLAARAVTSHPGPLNMIGNLTGGSYCPGVVRLTQEQKDVITKLDKLVRKALYHSMMADAEPFDGPPAVRRKLLAHSAQRRSDAIHHAQRLVFLGLLTEEQASSVTQRYLESMGMGALNNDNVGVAEQIEFTDGQRGKLAEVNARFLQQISPKIPEAMSPDRRVGEEYYI